MIKGILPMLFKLFETSELLSANFIITRQWWVIWRSLSRAIDIGIFYTKLLFREIKRSIARCTCRFWIDKSLAEAVKRVYSMVDIVMISFLPCMEISRALVKGARRFRKVLDIGRNLAGIAHSPVELVCIRWCGFLDILRKSNKQTT
jgi:hypothetical protein